MNNGNDGLHLQTYRENQTPLATLSTSVSQTGRKQKKLKMLDSPGHRNLPGRSFQKKAKQKSLFS